MNPTPTTLSERRSRALRSTRHASRVTPQALRSSPGFTLVEILVTIALLSFIVLGLFAVFNQVQRAFRDSMNQVDQLEAGRAATETLPREFEQMTPSGFPDGANFYAGICPFTPLSQALPGTAVRRVNVVQDCFMLLRSNQTWIGIGYCVRSADTNNILWPALCKPGQMAVGSLYRHTATLPVLYTNAPGDANTGLPLDPRSLYDDFCTVAKYTDTGVQGTNFSRICDGVIQFQLQAFAPNGALIAPTVGLDGIVGYRFWSNAVPASVEMELGILEQHALDRYYSIVNANPDAALAYLQRPENASHVHLFRQRIPIRNVDLSAYP